LFWHVYKSHLIKRVALALPFRFATLEFREEDDSLRTSRIFAAKTKEALNPLATAFGGYELGIGFTQSQVSKLLQRRL
jgi:hypothetical protein